MVNATPPARQDGAGSIKFVWLIECLSKWPAPLYVQILPVSGGVGGCTESTWDAIWFDSEQEAQQAIDLFLPGLDFMVPRQHGFYFNA